MYQRTNKARKRMPLVTPMIFPYGKVFLENELERDNFVFHNANFFF